MFLTLSEETAHPTGYHHLGQFSFDIQLSVLIKFREYSSTCSVTEFSVQTDPRKRVMSVILKLF